MLEFAQKEGESHGRPVVFFYPSSIAAFGIPTLAAKTAAGRVKEDEFNFPTTMYGANKLYCEHLGRYYSRHYKQLAADPHAGRVDFRCLRFPGLISAETMPSGGTSDYAPEMIHAAAAGKPYDCFVRPDTPHPVHGHARRRGGHPAADGRAARETDPQRSITSPRSRRPQPRSRWRCALLSHWPRWGRELTRSARASSIPGRPTWTTARRARDWGHAPRHDFRSCFRDYLIPIIRKRYSVG